MGISKILLRFKTDKDLIISLLLPKFRDNCQALYCNYCLINTTADLWLFEESYLGVREKGNRFLSLTKLEQTP